MMPQWIKYSCNLKRETKQYHIITSALTHIPLFDVGFVLLPETTK
jgi:hypothetical protein